MASINGSLIPRTLAAALALTLAWPGPAFALRRQAPSETSGLEEFAASLRSEAGLEERTQPPEQSRREFLKTLAALAQLSTRLGALAAALAPSPSSGPPAWEPYREALPLAISELGEAAGESRELIWDLTLRREAEKAGIRLDPQVSAESLTNALSTDTFPDTEQAVATHVQWAETLQRRLATQDRREALIQQLRRAVGAEISRLESSALQQSFKATMGEEGWPLPEYRALATMLDTIPASEIAQGLGWAAGQHLQYLAGVVDDLRATAAMPHAQARLTRQVLARAEWKVPTAVAIARAVKKFRVIAAPDFRRFEHSMVGFYLERDGLRFVRPLALAIAQAPAGVATLAGVVPTEADKTTLVDSLTAVPAAQTLVADGVATLEQVPDARDAREEAFRRLHTRGATYSHMITAAHDEDPVAYLRRLLFQFGVMLPPHPERSDELDPATHIAVLTLLRAASGATAGLEEPTEQSDDPMSRREFLQDTARTITALVHLGRKFGALADLFASRDNVPAVPPWDPYRDILSQAAESQIGPTTYDTKRLWVLAKTDETLGRMFSGNPLEWGLGMRRLHQLLDGAFQQAQALQGQLTTTEGRASLTRALRNRRLSEFGSLTDEQLTEGFSWAVGERLRMAQSSLAQHAAETKDYWALVVQRIQAATAARYGQGLSAGASTKPLTFGARQPISEVLGQLWEQGMTLTPEQIMTMVNAQAVGANEIMFLERSRPAAGTTVTLHATGEVSAWLTSRVPQWPAWPSAEAAVTFAVPGGPGPPGTGNEKHSQGTVPGLLSSYAVAVRLASQPHVEGMPNLVVHALEALDRVTAELVVTVAHATLPSDDQDLPVIATMPLTVDGREVLALFL
ncbi:MAG: hypothetical protein HY600_00510 [Candidatus Omnitrophica bacterium]|nr:hypothetical protein [Candidatus Omnitrophota bacterium]